MARELRDEVFKSFDKLLSDGTYSDLTIKSSEKEFKVHKAIVCPRSPFFEKACNNTQFKEGRTGVISLPWIGDDFISAVDEIYTTTMEHDTGMRDAVVKAIAQSPSVLNKEPFREMVRRHDLSFELMMKFRGNSWGWQEPGNWASSNDLGHSYGSWDQQPDDSGI